MRAFAATRFPDKETVEDDSQGVPLALMPDLARYRATEYDWRRCEARLNAVPNFVTEIDGLDIHFIHVRAKHEDALPLVVCHGWPGSIVEQLKIIGPLTDPTGHGANASESVMRGLLGPAKLEHRPDALKHFEVIIRAESPLRGDDMVDRTALTA